MTTKKTNMLDKGVKIELDRVRYMRFDLNALVELQEEFGDVIEVFQSGLQKQDFKVIRKLLHVSLLDDDGEGGLTEHEVGRLITMNNLTLVIDALSQSLSASVPQDDEGKK